MFGINIDLTNSIFLLCALVGGVLLLVSVVLGDLFDGVLGIFDFDVDIGGASVMPVALGFIAMFGVGGLVGTQTFNLSAGPASIVGVITGALGAAAVTVMFGFLRRAEAPESFGLSDLVGVVGRVSVNIRANSTGAVTLSHAGSTHTFSATAAQELLHGSVVKVVGVAGSALIVEPFVSESVSPASEQNI